VTYNDDGDPMVYRVATDAELETSGKKVSAANKSVREGEQRVTDRTKARDKAKENLASLQATLTYKGRRSPELQKKIDDAEEALADAEQDLVDATTDLTEKREKVTEATSSDEELRTQGKQVKAKANTYKGEEEAAVKTSKAAGGMSGSDLGKTFFSGIMESIGLDGSLFSNPLEWPSVKSLMAGVNWAGGLLSIAGAQPEGAAAAGAAVSGGGGGGFAGGIAESVGLGGLLSAIPNIVGPSTFASAAIPNIVGPSTFASGSPVLAPGELNPSVPGAKVASGAGSGSAFAVAPNIGGGAAPGAVDNSININGNVGMNPSDVQTKVNSMQNARTRTTVIR
jgi:hypothetical protein